MKDLESLDGAIVLLDTGGLTARAAGFVGLDGLAYFGAGYAGLATGFAGFAAGYAGFTVSGLFASVGLDPEFFCFAFSITDLIRSAACFYLASISFFF